MYKIALTQEERAMLVGWLRREKDFLLSAESVCKRLLVPLITGTLENLRTDLEFIQRVRQAVSNPNEDVLLSHDDIDILLQAKGFNTFKEKDDFWTNLHQILEKAIEND